MAGLVATRSFERSPSHLSDTTRLSSDDLDGGGGARERVWKGSRGWRAREVEMAGLVATRSFERSPSHLSDTTRLSSDDLDGGGGAMTSPRADPPRAPAMMARARRRLRRLKIYWHR